MSIKLHTKVAFHPFPFNGIRLKSMLKPTETTRDAGIIHRNVTPG